MPDDITVHRTQATASSWCLTSSCVPQQGPRSPLCCFSVIPVVFLEPGHSHSHRSRQHFPRTESLSQATPGRRAAGGKQAPTAATLHAGPPRIFRLNLGVLPFLRGLHASPPLSCHHLALPSLPRGLQAAQAAVQYALDNNPLIPHDCLLHLPPAIQSLQGRKKAWAGARRRALAAVQCSCAAALTRSSVCRGSLQAALA